MYHKNTDLKDTDLKVRVGDIICISRVGMIEIRRGPKLINSRLINYSERNPYIFQRDAEGLASLTAENCEFSIRKISEDKECIAFEFMEKRQVDNLPGNF
jgi:hypothetical protein